MTEGFRRNLDQRSSITAAEATEIVEMAARFIDLGERSDEADNMVASLAINAVSRLAKSHESYGTTAAVNALGTDGRHYLEQLLDQSDITEHPATFKEEMAIKQLRSSLEVAKKKPQVKVS